ncbi:hypothetical protein CPB84DRAFT_1744421 [Gymnopilus junonius]|uniref:Uncharacterized protein n=1 Tax=Gymnopilus junonius TaxID=109634 RepID=A0A9P5NXH1_GYMJU|nr:hypothetical protein CPB84DRAFT_1744421 [Gymnopilus junonius]
MVNSAFLSLLSLALASSAFASATPRATDSLPGAGAAYFILDEPAQKIVSLKLASDGTLSSSSARVVSAGGVGQRVTHIPPGLGKPDSFFSPGPDPLFTQGSIVVNQKAGILVTVNPGSNTVALFSIDTTDPTKLTQVGKAASSGGDFPVSVAINSKGNTVCVLNGGAKNGINCFSVHPFFGLIPKPNTLRFLSVNQTTPPTGPLGSFSTIVFSPDDSKVLVAAKAKSFVATWEFKADGSLSNSVISFPADAARSPFTLVNIPGSEAYVAADPTIGFLTFNFGNSKSLTATDTATLIENQVLACWTAYSPKSENFYIVDPILSTITEVHYDTTLNPSIIKQYALLNNSATLDSIVSVIDNHAYLHVLQPLATAITVLSADRPGALSHVQTFNLTSAFKEAGLSTWNNLNFQGMATYIKA